MSRRDASNYTRQSKLVKVVHFALASPSGLPSPIPPILPKQGNRS